MILAHVLSLSTGWISSFGVFRGRPRGPGAKRRWGLCSGPARCLRVRNGWHLHPRQSRHRPSPPTVHGIRNTVLQTYLINLRVVRPATWKVKRNDGGRVNMPEKKIEKIESMVPCFPCFPVRRGGGPGHAAAGFPRTGKPGQARYFLFFWSLLHGSGSGFDRLRGGISTSGVFRGRGRRRGVKRRCRASHPQHHPPALGFQQGSNTPSTLGGQAKCWPKGQYVREKIGNIVPLPFSVSGSSTTEPCFFAVALMVAAARKSASRGVISSFYFSQAITFFNWLEAPLSSRP